MLSAGPGAPPRPVRVLPSHEPNRNNSPSKRKEKDGEEKDRKQNEENETMETRRSV